MPRFGPALQATGLSVLRAFEAAGVPTVNASGPFALARDKPRSLLALHEAGVPVPATAIACDPAEADAAIERVGGPPVVIKTRRGWHGAGVVLAESVAAARSMVQLLADARQPLVVQRFVGEAKGSDLRLLVAGDRVVAGMRRTAAAGEFRANAGQGGSVEALGPDPELEKIALEATRAHGLAVAGVDLIESKDGPLF